MTDELAEFALTDGEQASIPPDESAVNPDRERRASDGFDSWTVPRIRRGMNGEDCAIFEWDVFVAVYESYGSENHTESAMNSADGQRQCSIMTGQTDH
jgi:hypothetical protein